jgi:endonuclease/exonuclease/phosphatase family metal-dependent hydrolase
MFTLVHYNIYHGKGTDKRRNLARQIPWLRGGDLVSLNECDSQAMAMEYAELLGKETGVAWRYAYFPCGPNIHGNVGQAVLAKSHFTSIDARSLGWSRSALHVAAPIDGRDVHLFCAHLSASGYDKDRPGWPTPAEQRSEQIALLMEWAAGFPEPRIICGDLNAAPDAAEMAPLFSAYPSAWESARLAGTAEAYPDNPVARDTRTLRLHIDYILCSRGSGLKTLAFRIPDTRDLTNQDVQAKLGTPDDLGVRPSDHNPLIASLDF